MTAEPDAVMAASTSSAPGLEPTDPSSTSGVDLDALYRAQSPTLLKSLRRGNADVEDARDLLHDIFCRVAGMAPERLPLIERPHAYLGRMATNLLRDRAKRNARHKLAHHVPIDDTALAAPDMQQVLESRDMLRRVEAAVLKLRPRTREVFLAHRVEGLSYAEIATRTGLSIKGVEKQMSKAIARIDRLLERHRA